MIKFYIVDMINGFCKEGKLADPRIMNIVPRIKEIYEALSVNTGNHVEVSYFIDSHRSGDPELLTFPYHCMKDSEESKVIDELDIKGNLVYKNSTNGFFSLDVNSLSDDDIHIVGCCSDICVLTLAICLRTYFNHRGYLSDIIVHTDAISTYDSSEHPAEEYQNKAVDLMKLQGIICK